MSKFGKDWGTVIEKYEPKETLRNGKYVPAHPFRLLVVGESGSGKTYLINSMLFSDDPDTTIYFDEIHICTKNPDETAYRILRDAIKTAEETIDEIERELGRMAPPAKIGHWYTNPSELMNLIDTMDESSRRIVLFDDQELNQAGKDGKIMEEFFQRCRKKGTSAIFIAQTLYGTSKFIRRNCNYKIMFAPRSKREITLLSQDVALDKDVFTKHAQEAWRQKYGWIMIDKDNKLRIGFSDPVSDDSGPCAQTPDNEKK